MVAVVPVIRTCLWMVWGEMMRPDIPNGKELTNARPGYIHDWDNKTTVHGKAITPEDMARLAEYDRQYKLAMESEKNRATNWQYRWIAVAIAVSVFHICKALKDAGLI